MKTHCEFKSRKFPPYEGEEDQINTGCWGKRLAEYLVIKLKEQGIETEEINAEDWGWEIPVCNDIFSMWIGCSRQDGENGNDEFLCFIEPHKSIIRKWFIQKIDTAEKVGRLSRILEKILTNDPDIREFRWWNDEELKLAGVMR